MPQSTSAAHPFRSNCLTSSGAMRARSSAHDALWSLASTLSEDACDDRSCRSKISSDAAGSLSKVAPFKLPSVSLPFLRPLRSADYDCDEAPTFKLPGMSLPPLHSAERQRQSNTTKQGHSTPPKDDVCRKLRMCPSDEDLAAMLKWLDDTEGFDDRT
ncbi:hypothetical protein T484DRAFT_1891338 [Baffinella frigidus]|nr:hypothetical protein T484DRAFT_1891338 [Cryptophyta sp. CCMP2293]|mmetsp:Transcript_20389/g.48395  ORF Transcript_20389/g.48395 Transcript_20389/m.48395 type:complete len:158 (-) Transcript_20389:82-555(-)|eukprot:CAMPEP_0180148028 /NCGR_PEP_ID=MMETSP0986-20121125/19703_1 /TAXON_ID=697907 /ORGANISM="non described non described, Strain CCMP2293" /LENGTH=157 /DNA_ID=CAMNT_0022093881 /DNA_START=26 /DNA_END=499 /DNA_ORIENTATION=-